MSARANKRTADKQSNKATTSNKVTSPITAATIDAIINNPSNYTIEQLQQTLQYTRESIANMQKQIALSKEPLPKTESALRHWKVREENLGKLLSSKLNKNSIKDSKVVRPSEDDNSTDDLVEVFIPSCDNAISRAFMEATIDMLPPKVVGKIYQAIPEYLTGARPEYYLDRKDLLGNLRLMVSSEE